MNVLFVMRHSGYVRNFESTLRLLCDRGHSVQLGFQIGTTHWLLDPAGGGPLPDDLSEQAINKADCFCIRTDPSVCLPEFLALRLACRSTFLALEQEVHGARWGRRRRRSECAFGDGPCVACSGEPPGEHRCRQRVEVRLACH